MEAPATTSLGGLWETLECGYSSKVLSRSWVNARAASISRAPSNQLTISLVSAQSPSTSKRRQRSPGRPSPSSRCRSWRKHCGWNRQTAFTPDRSTQAYLAQAIDIANANADLFSCGDPVEAIHLLDDFHSAGRISGSKRIPLAKLTVGESHTIEGQRLEVNESLTRYQRELKSLALSI